MRLDRLGGLGLGRIHLYILNGDMLLKPLHPDPTADPKSQVSIPISNISK